MSKLSRVKGATWERKLANILKEVWPSAKRGIGQTRAASEVADIDGVPFWVEAKHWKKTTRGNLTKAMAQAKTANNTGKPCVVIAKENCSRDIVVVVETEWFMRLGPWCDDTYLTVPSVSMYLDEFIQLCVVNKIGGAIAPASTSESDDEA